MIFTPRSTVVFIGDSISDCNRLRPVGEGKEASLGTSYIAHANALIRANYPQHRLRMISMGFGGHNSRDLLNRWQTDVLDLNPDYVAIMIGINDVWRQFDVPLLTHRHVYLDEYRDNLRKMVELTFPQTKNVIFLSPFFMELNKDDAMRSAMDKYGDAMREVAQEHGLLFVDVQKAFDDYFQHHHPMSVAWDRIHPDMTGHMVIAKAFLDAVGFEWNRSVDF
jgi:lysophospholipase L1-like esterase